MKVLLLRLDAPMMSFGGLMVDGFHPSRRFPTRAFLTGLLGNAMGYRWQETTRLDALQASLIHATRWDVTPELMREYQTVDLGQAKMTSTKKSLRANGWTTYGVPEIREGGDVTEGTHQMQLEYLADGVATVAVSLASGATLSLEAIAEAVMAPERPIYFGRKTCVPAAPVFLGLVEAETVVGALKAAPLVNRVTSQEAPLFVEAQWSVDEQVEEAGRLVWIPGSSMDWATRIHVGREKRMEGYLEITK